MSDETFKNQSFLLGLFGGIAVVAVIGLVVVSVVLVRGNSSKGDVKGETVQNLDVDPSGAAAQPTGPQAVQATAAGVNTFSEKAGAEICTEDGKPVVYLFTTTWCPHCTWIKDAFDSLVGEYVAAGKIVAHHWEVDTNDDTLTADKESVVPPAQLAVYQEFNPRGSIPTFVFGCKYFRVGNGYESANDLDAEVAEFKAVIEDLLK